MCTILFIIIGLLLVVGGLSGKLELGSAMGDKPSSEWTVILGVMVILLGVIRFLRLRKMKTNSSGGQSILH